MASTAHDLMESASVKVTETTQALSENVKSMGVVQRYIVPPIQYAQRKYNQSPLTVKATLISFGIMSAIPVGCFTAFMTVVTMGCLIVGAIAFTIVEGGFALFGSAFLLPALGVSLLVTGGLALGAMVAYGAYMATMYIISKFWGTGTKRDVQRKVERGAEKAQDVASSTGGNR